MTLVEFILARYAEDEAAAKRAAAIALRWVDAGSLLLGLTEEPDIYDLDFAEATNYRYDDALTHAARHDPARVLAEVEAKRRIIDEHSLMVRDIGWLDEGHEEVHEELEVCARCVPKHSHFTTRADVPTGPCRTVRLLALPYADHPDYDPAWRP